MTELDEDPNAELRAAGDVPIPLFPQVTHWAVIEWPRFYGNGLRDGGWTLHPLYERWPESVRAVVQSIAEAVEPRFCFNCAAKLGYRNVGEQFAEEWWPVHLIQGDDGGITAVCPGCAVPF